MRITQIITILGIVLFTACTEQVEIKPTVEDRVSGVWQVEQQHVSKPPIFYRILVEKADNSRYEVLGLQKKGSLVMSSRSVHVEGSVFAKGEYTLTEKTFWNNPKRGWEGKIEFKNDSLRYRLIK